MSKPLKCLRRSAGCVALVVSAAGFPTALAQADLRVTVTRADESALTLSWPSQSLVPPPGMQLFADYQVFTSKDLQTWSPAGDVIRGSEIGDQEVRREIGRDESPALFFKVESILDFSGRDFIRGNLVGANFERVSLFGSDLFSANLNNANLRSADLQATDLRFSALNEADLRGALLMGANLSFASLQLSDLRDADLSFSDFTGAALDGADLAGADLRFTSLLQASVQFIALQRTLIDDHTLLSPRVRLIWNVVNHKMAGARITDEDLTLCNLLGSNLENTIFDQVDLRGSDLRDANLSGADLRNARLAFVGWLGAQFSDSTQISDKDRLIWELINQDSSGRDLEGRDLSTAWLFEVNLSRANLADANLSLAVLINANLEKANFSNAVMVQADCTGANLRDTDLSHANLSGADLTDADLLNADMSNTILTGAIFLNTRMPDGRIR